MVLTFRGGFWKSRGKVPVVDDVLSSHEQKMYPTSSLSEKCIDFEFRTDGINYVNLKQKYLVLQLKLIKGYGYATYKTKDFKKEHKEEARTGDETEEETLNSRVTHVNNIFHSFFPLLRCTSTIGKFKLQMVSMCTSLTIPTTSMEPFFNTGVLCFARCTTMKSFFKKLRKRLFLNLFYKENENAQ